MTKPQNPSCPQNANLQNQQKQSNNNRSAQTNKQTNKQTKQTNKETNKQKATKENERECAPELSRNKNVYSKTATDETVGFVPNEMISSPSHYICIIFLPFNCCGKWSFVAW